MLGPVRPLPLGEELVDVHRLALRPALDHPLALVVVLVVLLLAVVEHRLDAVLLVPGDGPARAVLVVRPAGLVAVRRRCRCVGQCGWAHAAGPRSPRTGCRRRRSCSWSSSA